MARETKFGLGLIAVLCVGLIGAIVWRVSREMAARSTPSTEIVQATSPPPKSHEPPKLLVSSADSEPGEAKPPTKVAAVAKRSDSWARAQLASAAEPASLPAKHRYPLMPAAATTDQRPSLAKDEAPADFSPVVLPHTSYRPDDEAVSPAPISPPVAAAAVAAPATSRRYRARPTAETAPLPSGEAVTIAGQQTADAPRYAEPAFAPSAPAAVRPAAPTEPGTTYPPEGQRAWPRTDAAPRSPRALTPAPLAPAPDRGDGTTVVRPNDTFWTISQRAYGTGGYFKALIHYNSEKHPQPDQLAVGDTVLVPPVAELVQKYPQFCPKPRRGSENEFRDAAAPMAIPGGRRYEVREGDTLFDIARYELGDGARWVEIYQLNRDQLTDDFHYLKPGSTLNLPGRQQQQSERVAREPVNTRLR